MKSIKIVAVGLLSLCFMLTITAQTRPGSLRGVIVDANLSEPIPFATIVIYGKKGNVVTGGTSDVDGRYNINPIPPGIYDVVASFTGYASMKVIDIQINTNAIMYQNFELQEQSEMLQEVIIECRRPLLEKSKSSSIITAEDIRFMAVRDIESLATPSAGITSDVYPHAEVRGSRSEGTVYFIDGIMVHGSVNIPQAAIAQSPILTGGTPASIGDHPNPLYDYEIDFISPQQIHYDKDDAIEEEPQWNKYARILTAGELNDFGKWELWEDFTNSEFETWKEHWAINPTERYSIQLSYTNGAPVIDGVVKLKGTSGSTLFSAKTDNTGKAELWKNLFSDKEQVEFIEVEKNSLRYVINKPKLFQQGINLLQIDQKCHIPNLVDICFVVDATGSMGDEINYLKAELGDVISNVNATLTNINIRLGSVFYRDEGDEYITRHIDFSMDINKGLDFIKEQNAGGGGDFPEAVNEALDLSINQLSWSEIAITRIMFLILDAPPHYDSEKVAEIQKLIARAAESGIRIIPIASSGIDKSTEYLLRSLALTTNGTYTFLTDDSGVGNAHIEPTTDSYEVELLNDLMVRLIHQFAFTAKCTRSSQDLLQKTVSDSLQLAHLDSTNIDGSDSSNISQINPRDINKILKKRYSEKFNWHLFPNPTHDVVHVEFNHKIEEIYLTDLRGKILVRELVNGRSSVKINLISYPVGTYFIRFIHDGKWVTERVIKTY